MNERQGRGPFCMSILGRARPRRALPRRASRSRAARARRQEVLDELGEVVGERQEQRRRRLRFDLRHGDAQVRPRRRFVLGARQALHGVF